jgi:hypothetical protein
MNDPFDTLITESLHHDAANAPRRGAGFGDVRHRVHRRRQRNVAAMTVPAVLGVAALGLRPSPHQSGGPVGGSGTGDAASTTGVLTTGVLTSTSIVTNATGAVSPSSASVPTASTVEVLTSTSVQTSTSVPTPTSEPTASTVGAWTVPPITAPSDQIAYAVCLNASGEPNYRPIIDCQNSIGVGRSLKAGRPSDVSFVMALDSADQRNAAKAANTLGLPLRPLDTSYLPVDVDLYRTPARVVVVIGTPLAPPYTLPPHSTMPPQTMPESPTTSFFGTP